MSDSFPCSSCKAGCCGPVPLSCVRLKKIHGFIATLPETERARLAAQKRRLSDCAFLDQKTFQCAIYPVRPWLCKAFGRVKGMQCPKMPGLVQIIPPILQEMNFKIEYESGFDVFSNEIDWSKV